MSMAAVREHALWEGGGAGRGHGEIVGILIGTRVTCNFAFNLHRKILLLGKFWAGLGLFA